MILYTVVSTFYVISTLFCSVLEFGPVPTSISTQISVLKESRATCPPPRARPLVRSRSRNNTLDMTLDVESLVYLSLFSHAMTHLCLGPSSRSSRLHSRPPMYVCDLCACG